MKKISFLIITTLLFTFGACEKDAGDGGNSTITGKVHITKYNAFFTIVQGDYAGADEDVYIIYGEDATYGDRVKSGPDGRFEFKYLREGKYKIYVYTSDTTLSDTIGKLAIYKEAEIAGKKQTIDCGTLEIKKN